MPERSERAAQGAALLRADTAEDGVVRRTARLTNIGNEPASSPSQQLASVDVTVDVEAQTMTGAATLNAAPDPGAAVAVYVGTWDGRSCVTGFVAGAAPGVAQGAGQFADGEQVGVTSTTQGNQVTISTAAHPRLRNTPFECAFARVSVNTPGGATLSTAYADDLEDSYKPVLEVEPDDKMVGARAGKWAKVRLELRNTSRGPASSVRLTATGKGIDVRSTNVYSGAVDARSTEYLDVQVRLKAPKGKKGKKAKLKPRTLTLTATDPAAATATAQVTVVLTPKPTIPKKLTGTYWWGWESTNLQSRAGWINHSIWFVDKKWAHTGWAEGKKPRCSAKVKECVRYSYNPRTGTVKLGKQRAKVTSEGFTFKHPAYKDEKLRVEPLTLPKKGTKLALDLYHQNWSGYCAITCTSYTDYLTMDRTNKFVEGGFSVGSWPGLGQSWSSAPADQRGTYKVVATGIIELSYADGTREREVIGIQHDPSGKPNPAAAGVVLGDTNFYD
ncbi:hypothetical protein GCM10009797_14950 [Nocardioides hwasunensis]